MRPDGLVLSDERMDAARWRLKEARVPEVDGCHILHGDPDGVVVGQVEAPESHFGAGSGSDRSA